MTTTTALQAKRASSSPCRDTRDSAKHRYSLTPPSVSPDMSHLDEYMNSNIAGTATNTDAAENTPHWVVNWSRSFWNPAAMNMFVF